MNEIDIECASANQLQASAIPRASREIFLVGSEISEAQVEYSRNRLEEVKFICGGIHNYYITNKPTE